MEKVSSAAIQQLKSLYPTTAESACLLHPVLDNPWYLVAAVAFNAARQPESVLSVYKFVLEDLRAHYNNPVDDGDHVSLVKRIQEALLKASVTNGIPQTVTTILLFNSIVPKAILEKLSQTPLRDFDRSFSDLASHGSQFLSETFGEVEGAQAQGLIKSSTPDIGMFTNVSYGLILGYSSVVSLLETSYIFIAASILDEFPRQARWYYLAAVRQGSTVDQIKAVREMALKVASLSDITLREKVPEVVATELLR